MYLLKKLRWRVMVVEHNVFFGKGFLLVENGVVELCIGLVLAMEGVAELVWKYWNGRVFLLGLQSLVLVLNGVTMEVRFFRG